MKKFVQGVISFVTIMIVSSLFFLSCAPQVSIESKNNSTNNENQSSNSEESQQNETTFLIQYETEFGNLPENLSNGINIKEDTFLDSDYLPTLFSEGYAFEGWFDGETKVISDKYKVHKNVTLKAKWIKETVYYTITFESEHGTVPESKKISESTILSEEDLPTLTEYGYRFDGWYDGQKKINVGIDSISKNLQLKAKWIACLIIHFNANGGTGTMPDQFMDGDGEPHQLIKNTFKKEGYIFVGWDQDPNYNHLLPVMYNDENYIYPVSLSKPQELNTLYARWEPITYTVRFDTNKGLTEDVQYIYGGTHSYHYEDLAISKNGIYISSWNTKPDGTGVSYKTGEGRLWRDVTFDDISTQNNIIVSLYAQWETSSYTIILDSEQTYVHGVTENGESKVCVEMKYGESFILNNPFQISRYYVVNWSRYKGSGLGYEYYENDSELINLSSEHGDIVTLFPVWRSTQYRIHFDANGGTGRDMYEICGYFDEEVTMPENVFTRSGYTFICWEGGYPAGSKAINLSGREDFVSLKAIWASSHGGTLEMDVLAKNAASIIELLPKNGIYSLHLYGECMESTLEQIGISLKERKNDIKTYLYLEETEGLTKVVGFSDCTSLQGIWLPTNVKIGTKAFYGCSNLKGVYFPNYTSQNSSLQFYAKGTYGQKEIELKQYSYGTIEISSTFRDVQTITNANNAKEVFAELLIHNLRAQNGLFVYEGELFEWEIE